MELNQVNTREDDEALTQWRDAFIQKNAGLRCPHHGEHEDFYAIKDLHADGTGGFTYHVEACCPAYELIVKPMVSQERLWNPPVLSKHNPNASDDVPLHPVHVAAVVDTHAPPPRVDAVQAPADGKSLKKVMDHHSVLIELRRAHDLHHTYKMITVHSSFVDFMSHGQKPRLYIEGAHARDYYPAFFSDSPHLCLVIDLP